MELRAGGAARSPRIRSGVASSIRAGARTTTSPESGGRTLGATRFSHPPNADERICGGRPLPAQRAELDALLRETRGRVPPSVRPAAANALAIPRPRWVHASSKSRTGLRLSRWNSMTPERTFSGCVRKIGGAGHVEQRELVGAREPRGVLLQAAKRLSEGTHQLIFTKRPVISFIVCADELTFGPEVFTPSGPSSTDDAPADSVILDVVISILQLPDLELDLGRPGELDFPSSFMHLVRAARLRVHLLPGLEVGLLASMSELLRPALHERVVRPSTVTFSARVTCSFRLARRRPSGCRDPRHDLPPASDLLLVACPRRHLPLPGDVSVSSTSIFVVRDLWT